MKSYLDRSHVHISTVGDFVIKRVLAQQSLLSPTCSSYPGQVPANEFRISWNAGSVLPLSLVVRQDKSAGNTDNKLKILDLSCKIVPYVYYWKDFCFKTQESLMA